MTQTPNGNVDAALVVKFPEPGRVKTRLAASIGDDAAAAWYRQAGRKTFDMLCRAPGVQVHVVYDPPDQRDAIEAWLPDADSYLPQCSGDLGKRLTEAAQSLWAQHKRPQLFLGGDCPELDAPYLSQACEVLADGRSVVGPATDGGYVLLGLHRPIPEVFADIDWSTEQVLQQTLQRFAQTGEFPVSLGLLCDVDTVDDLRKVEPGKPSFSLKIYSRMTGSSYP